MHHYAASADLSVGDKFRVKPTDPAHTLLPPVTLSVFSDGDVPQAYLRMTRNQLDQLILEATACQRELDNTIGV